MQFEVKLRASRGEVMAYCFNRIREIWPEAVLADPEGERVYRQKVTGVETFGPIVRIYQNRDAQLSAALFSNPRIPSILIEVQGERVLVIPSDSAGEITDRLASLPIWAHRVTESNRLPSL